MISLHRMLLCCLPLLCLAITGCEQKPGPIEVTPPVKIDPNKLQVVFIPKNSGNPLFRVGY